MNCLQLVATGTTTLIAAMGGAWAGAYIAFKLERRAKKQDKMETDINAVLDAMLSFGIMGNEVRNYKKQVIGPHQDDPLRHIKIRATIATNEKFDIPWGRLVFLMPSNGNLLLHMRNIQSAYSQLMQSIKERNREHIRYLQPKIEEVGFCDSEEEMRRALGQRLFASMRNRTDGIIQLVDFLDERLICLIDDLRVATIAIYPNAKIQKFEFDESLESVVD